MATTFLEDNPTIVKNLITGLVDSIDYIAANTDEAEAANDGIEKITTKRLA